MLLSVIWLTVWPLHDNVTMPDECKDEPPTLSVYLNRNFAWGIFWRLRWLRHGYVCQTIRRQKKKKKKNCLFQLALDDKWFTFRNSCASHNFSLTEIVVWIISFQFSYTFTYIWINQNLQWAWRGLITYLKREYTHDVRDLYKSSDMWGCLFIDVFHENPNKKIAIGNIYRPLEITIQIPQ